MAIFMSPASRRGLLRQMLVRLAPDVLRFRENTVFHKACRDNVGEAIYFSSECTMDAHAEVTADRYDERRTAARLNGCCAICGG
jgi:hypothetical protein